MLGPHKNLQVWQRGMQFVTELYRCTNHFPQSEVFGLVSQMRRAAVSITSNIAEGYGRNTNTELLHFLYISLGSSNELETQIIIAFNLGFLSQQEYDNLIQLNDEINKMLRSLIYIKSQLNP
ncbi:MAG: four helix bundle protein [Bacteroidales bacterium]|nr:four helix bundle protein [Bacteroidales bacterium]